jgi:hypothetical protein
VPASWFVIDWLGSGKLSNSAEAAQHTSQGGPLLHHYPGLATLRETWSLMSGPLETLFLLALAWSLIVALRSPRITPALWLAAGSLGWAIVDALLAQARLATGAPRYLLPAVGLAAIVIGVAVADWAEAIARRLPGPHTPAIAAAAGVVVVVLLFLMTPRLDRTGHQVSTGIRIGRDYARSQTSVRSAAAVAGGRAAVLRCGALVTGPFQVPLVAWTFDVPVGQVGIVADGSGTILRQRGAPAVRRPVLASYRTLGSVGPPSARWTVLSSCR